MTWFLRGVVCYIAVLLCVVTQCSSLRDDTKSSCVADYSEGKQLIKIHQYKKLRSSLFILLNGK